MPFRGISICFGHLESLEKGCLPADCKIEKKRPVAAGPFFCYHGLSLLPVHYVSKLSTKHIFFWPNSETIIAIWSQKELELGKSCNYLQMFVVSARLDAASGESRNLFDSIHPRLKWNARRRRRPCFCYCIALGILAEQLVKLDKSSLPAG